VKSEAFRHYTQEGFFASLITNFLDPKLVGYSAAMYCLASFSPPVDYGGDVVDLEIAYRLSLEIAKYTLMPTERFRYHDGWTDKAGKKRSPSLRMFCLGIMF
jgi:hypothetical protein